jgi:hypothetical protein
MDEDKVTPLQDLHSKLTVVSTKVQNLLCGFFASIDVSFGIELKQYVLGISVKA